MADILLIGYGNELRGDDGIGPRVAEAIAERHYPGVRVMTCFQLVPELAADLAEARLAVFVDALADHQGRDIDLRQITPEEMSDWSTHTTDPRALLALTHAVYRHMPEAWWLLVPGDHFGFGETLSPLGRGNACKAVLHLETLLQTVNLHSKISTSYLAQSALMVSRSWSGTASTSRK